MSDLALNGGPKVRETPFHRWPDWDEREQNALTSVLEAGSWGGYPSPNTHAWRFASEFAQQIGVKHGVCCTNGSVALELALQAAGILPGDEVIVPAYTFVATASAAVFCHGIPVFVDVDPDTYCIDPKLIEDAINPKTKFIVVVHLACNMVDMDPIMALAKQHHLTVIEDCAHAHGHRWKGKPAGSIGHLATFSFQTSKLMTSGEGGIVVTDNDEYAERLHSLINCGRKETDDAFEGRHLGKNSRISEWQAAVLSVQLQRLEDQTALRADRMEYFEEKLSIDGLAFTTRDRRNTTRAAYQFIVKYDSKAFGGVHRDRFLEALRAEGVPAEGEFYVPLYKDPLFAMDRVTNPLCTFTYGSFFKLEGFDCPVTEKAAYEEAIWLPHQIFLGSEADVDDVVAAFKKVADGVSELEKKKSR